MHKTKRRYKTHSTKNDFKYESQPYSGFKERQVLNKKCKLQLKIIYRNILI